MGEPAEQIAGFSMLSSDVVRALQPPCRRQLHLECISSGHPGTGRTPRSAQSCTANTADLDVVLLSQLEYRAVSRRVKQSLRLQSLAGC